MKTFAELTDDELDAYLEANVAAVRDVVERAGGVDAALANHLVMGPAILARAGPRLRGQDPRLGPRVHGEAATRALPALRPRGHGRGGRGAGRLPPHGREPLGGGRRPDAAGEDPPRPARASTPTLFAPIPRAEREPRALRELAADAACRVRAATRRWDRDPERAAAARSSEFAAADGPRVVFVGKLIVSKGVDLLLAAWPLVHAANPGARLLVVGFGEYDDGAAAAVGGAGGRRPRRPSARSPRAAGRSRAGRRRRCGCSRLPRRDLPPATRTARRGGAGSVALRRPARARRGRPRWSRPPTRWSSRAPSRRRSGWSPPRRPRPACCRCRRRTPAPPR